MIKIDASASGEGRGLPLEPILPLSSFDHLIAR
jgi:hypothetical protein